MKWQVFASLRHSFANFGFVWHFNVDCRFDERLIAILADVSMIVCYGDDMPLISAKVTICHILA